MRNLGILLLACGVLPFLQCVDSESGAVATSSGDGGDSDGAVLGEGGPSDSGPAVPRVDVNGLLNGRASDGGPLPSRDVTIVDALGKSTTVVSGADGKFQVAGVATPYDIAIPYVPLDAAAPAYPFYYVGVSRPDPIVYTYDYSQASGPGDVQKSAPITFTATTCASCLVWFGGPRDNDRLSGSASSMLYNEPQYRWSDTDTLSQAFHILVQDTAGVFTTYVDIPTQTLHDGQTLALGTPTFAAIPSNGTMTINVTVPTGYTNDRTNVTIYESDKSRVGYTDTTDPVTTTSAKIPILPGILITGYASAAGPNGNGETTYGNYQAPTDAALTATFTLPTAPTLITPSSHATSVTDAQSLTWSPYTSPTVYNVSIGTTAGTDYTIYTTSPSFDLSRLTKAGMPLAGNTTWIWTLDGGGTVATMDDYATTQTAVPVSTTPVYYAHAAYQEFTTK